MFRRLLGPLIAVLFVLALPALVAAQDGGTATPAKQGHLRRIARSDCPQYRMGPVGVESAGSLYTKPQSASQEGISILTITAVTRGAGFVTDITDGPDGRLVATILAPRAGGGSRTVQLRIRLGPAGLVVINRTDEVVKVWLTTSPTCS